MFVLGDVDLSIEHPPTRPTGDTALLISKTGVCMLVMARSLCLVWILMHSLCSVLMLDLALGDPSFKLVVNTDEHSTRYIRCIHLSEDMSFNIEEIIIVCFRVFVSLDVNSTLEKFKIGLNEIFYSGTFASTEIEYCTELNSSETETSMAGIRSVDVGQQTQQVRGGMYYVLLMVH